MKIPLGFESVKTVSDALSFITVKLLVRIPRVNNEKRNYSLEKMLYINHTGMRNSH